MVKNRVIIFWGYPCIECPSSIGLVLEVFLSELAGLLGLLLVGLLVIGSFGCSYFRIPRLRLMGVVSQQNDILALLTD